MNVQFAKENDGEITITQNGTFSQRTNEGLQKIGDDSSR